MLGLSYLDRPAEHSTPRVPFHRRLYAKDVSTSFSGSSVVDGERVEGIRWQSPEIGHGSFEEARTMLSNCWLIIGRYQT